MSIYMHFFDQRFFLPPKNPFVLFYYFKLYPFCYGLLTILNLMALRLNYTFSFFSASHGCKNLLCFWRCCTQHRKDAIHPLILAIIRCMMSSPLNGYAILHCCKIFPTGSECSKRTFPNNLTKAAAGQGAFISSIFTFWLPWLPLLCCIIYRNKEDIILFLPRTKCRT